MLSLALPVEIYLCVTPADMRNYAVTVIMPSRASGDAGGRGSGVNVSLHNSRPFQDERSIANNLSGA